MLTREWGPLEQELESLGLLQEVGRTPCLNHGKKPKPAAGIEFAPDPPPGSYWPVAVTAKEGRCVSFSSDDGKQVGRNDRRFLAERSGNRYHVAIDLFARAGDPIIACEDGKVVGWIEKFLSMPGKPRYTSAILVQHAKTTNLYGEIDPKSREKTNVRVGGIVSAGQVIGHAGVNPGGSTMLHFETYRPGLKGNQRWYRDGSPPPSHVLNPTRYLLFLQEHGLTADGSAAPRAGGANVLAPGASSAPSPFVPSLDLDAAARENRRWGQKLGWLPSYDSIAWVLGFRNRTPDERTFAEAVAGFQTQNGLSSDGVIGPMTWKKLQPLLAIPQSLSRIGAIFTGGSTSTPKAPTAVPAAPTPPAVPRAPAPVSGELENVLYEQMRASWERHGLKPPERGQLGKLTPHRSGRGYSRYLSGLYVDDKLTELSNKGLVRISSGDLDMLQRSSNVETGGRLTALNSYDTAFMSVGFMQWTILWTKLQDWIARAPDAFSRYGIALEPTRVYTFSVHPKKHTERAIVGAPDAKELRSKEWALRFFFASLDLDAIVAEVPLALEHAERIRRKYVDRHKEEVTTHYNASPVLRALIQEGANNRPAYIKEAIEDAAARARASGGVTTERFLELLREEIEEQYVRKETKEKDVAKRRNKARRLISKTAVRRL